MLFCFFWKSEQLRMTILWRKKITPCEPNLKRSLVVCALSGKILTKVPDALLDQFQVHDPMPFVAFCLNTITKMHKETHFGRFEFFSVCSLAKE